MVTKNVHRSQKYKIVIQWNEKTQDFIAGAPQFEGCSVSGPTPHSVLDRVMEAIEQRLAVLENEGHSAPNLVSERKYSGKILLRIDPKLHREIAAEASMADIPLTHFIERKLGGK